MSSPLRLSRLAVGASALVLAYVLAGCAVALDPGFDPKDGGRTHDAGALLHDGAPSSDSGVAAPDTAVAVDTGTVEDDTAPPPEDTSVPDTARPPPDDGGLDPCNSCVESSCASELSSCSSDATCTDTMDCLGTCSDPTCADACVSKFGSTSFDTLMTCVSDFCRTDCGG